MELRVESRVESRVELRAGWRVEFPLFASNALTALMFVTTTKMLLENTRMRETTLKMRTALRPKKTSKNIYAQGSEYGQQIWDGEHEQARVGSIFSR